MAAMDRDEYGNMARMLGFTQVCMWPGAVVGLDKVADLEKFFMDEFGVRIQYLEEIDTYPDEDQYGRAVEGTGGRNDLFFAIHDDDIVKNGFAIRRLQYGIRWIEDVYGNGQGHLYAPRVTQYKSW